MNLLTLRSKKAFSRWMDGYMIDIREKRITGWNVRKDFLYGIMRFPALVLYRHLGKIFLF